MKKKPYFEPELETYQGPWCRLILFHQPHMDAFKAVLSADIDGEILSIGEMVDDGNRMSRQEAAKVFRRFADLLAAVETVAAGQGSQIPDAAQEPLLRFKPTSVRPPQVIASHPDK